MKIPSAANNACRSYILKCQEFNGAKNEHSRNGYSVSGRRVGHLYAVYSYGYWPMYVCDPRTDTWFVNAHRYTSAASNGNATSKQQSQCYPHGKDCAPMSTAELDAMLSMAAGGDITY
jgi:hypothetical protein